MTLGENIVRLRTAMDLSQEALADRLGVSRQSVSKWETDASVPELDKLIRLGEVFGVSLDELVKGKTTPEEREREGEKPVQAEPVRPVRNGSRTAGLVYLLLGLGLFLFLTLYGSIEIGLVFCLPFVVCGVLCLTLHAERMGLWCGWGLYFLADLYLYFATGLRWTTIFYTLQWTEQMNYTRLLIAWLQFLAAVLLIVLTALSWRREPLALDRKGMTLYTCGWAGVLLVWLGGHALLQMIWSSAVAADGRLDSGKELLFRWVSLARDWGVWILLAILLTVGVRVLLGRRKGQDGDFCRFSEKK